MRVLAVAALLACACAQYDDDVQQVQQFAKSVKGGHQGGFNYNPGSNLMFGNRSDHGYGIRHNMTAPQVGVCYIEVPTASLVRSAGPVPHGNGSTIELSRIRSCCKGYIRNIHNFYKCDPVCTQECVNALCTAPDTCTCFPDHVKNLAGYCVATCPIGCQNGQCAGGECLCKDGFKLDADGKFCVPTCKENCAGIGNCTAPNTCECKSGYQSSPEGSCKPVCDLCSNGECVAPNDCRCHQGFAKDQRGLCAPQCGPGYQTTPQGCKPVCERCTNGDCAGPNDCRCHQGYAKDPQGLCAPHCTPDCGTNSRCVAPNVCDPPISGGPQFYQPPNNQHSNYPLYPDNQHSNPNQPQPNGPQNPYQPNNQYPNQPPPSGIPQCSQPCLNGVCVEGNRCSCNPGYVLDRNDPSGTRCVPNCPGGCPNGVCSAPNFCICNMGYFKDHSVKGRPSCVKRVRRSADQGDKEADNKPRNVAELLIFEIPDY